MHHNIHRRIDILYVCQKQLGVKILGVICYKCDYLESTNYYLFKFESEIIIIKFADILDVF